MGDIFERRNFIMSKRGKTIVRLICPVIAILALTLFAKLSVGIVMYGVQMDNKKFAEETARVTGWTDKLVEISDNAEECLEKSHNVTVQLCRLLSDEIVTVIAVAFLAVGILFLCVTVKVTLMDIKYILKRSKRKRRV